MALRGTLTHRKTRRLAKLLGIPLPCALGVLEALWHVTGEQAKDGGIGRMSNQDLADEMFWDEDADDLVKALSESGWLQTCKECRLYVHDWHDHSDDATDNALARSGTKYANGSLPRMKRLTEQERAKLCDKWGWTHHEKPRQTTESHETPLPEPVPEPVPVLSPPTPSRGKREKFEPPTDFECAAYAKQIGIPGKEAKTFFDHFTSNGWKVGGKAPMKDWQAAMRTWKARLEDRGKVATGTYLDDIQEAP